MNSRQNRQWRNDLHEGSRSRARRLFPQTNIVLSNGQRGVLMSIYKTGSASTIEIVDKVKQMLDYNKASVPEGMRISTFSTNRSMFALPSRALSARPSSLPASRP